MRKTHRKPYQALHARIYLCGETDTSLANKVGLSQQQMSARMQGVCAFNAREIAQIGSALDLAPNEYYHLFIAPAWSRGA